mgnify:CR=1 FL=1
MSTISVILPDNSTRELEEGATIADCAAAIGSGLAKAAIAGKVDGELVGLDAPLADGAHVEIITNRSPEGLGILRHSTAHIMAEAVQELFPGAQIAFGPQTDDGFFYDFGLDETISSDDFEAIEAKMREIIKKDEPFVREVVTRDEAKEIFKDQKFKAEHIDDLPADAEISIYRHGDFVDLCKGPHIPSSKKIGAFKLMKVAGAYWKGDADNEQLQRLYGTAFFDKKDLKDYLHMLEEAEKRDHRKLGRELGIYMMDEEAGVGLPLYQPAGARIIRILQEWLRKELYRRGYEEVITPHIYKADVWKTSGHYGYYHDNMYFFEINEGSDEEPRLSEYGVKPMNCPGHVILYKNDIHSYRELPVRYFEFGTVYRYEQSGELHGLTRVRGFTQDDAHLFVRPDQLLEEFERVIDIVLYIFKTLSFDKFTAQVSLRDPNNKEKYIGSDENWHKAEQAIIEAAAEKGLKTTVELGEAAFYGPKLDFMVRDAIGRQWQLGTIQVDYNLPERFDLTYKGSDDKPHRPIMIHRAPFGSMERFVAVLLEHTGGKFPLWLSPDQAVVLPISEKFNDYAKKVSDYLNNSDIRATVDDRNEKIGRKIRDNELRRIPFLLIVGEKEEAEGMVSVRAQGEGDRGSMTQDEFIALVREKVAGEIQTPNK